MSKLALFGGKPVRESILPYGRQFIDDEDIKAVTRVLTSDYLTCGPEIAKLEAKLCTITGAKNAVAIANGTAALHAACFAAEIRASDEVVTTPITFAASANAILYCGGKPVFADIDSETWNISIDEIEKKITSKTKAIIAVDFTGQACEYKKIKKICKKNNIILIEDAAHSIGTRYENIPVGQIADLTTFSFHPVKTVTAGEGGAVLTDNSEYYEKLMMFRTHGITRNKELLIDKTNGDWYYEQQKLGYNYRITDIQAALCESQLSKIEKFIERRKDITKEYNRAFSQMNEVIVQKESPLSDTARHLYVIRLKPEQLSAGRKEIFTALKAENIGVNVHYIPVYYLPYYQNLGYKKGICPNAENYYETCITLPLFYSMSDNDVNDVITAVDKVINYYKK